MSARIDLRLCTLTLKDGLVGSAVSAKKTNEQQTITVTDATGGTFTVTYDSEETGNLPFDLTPAQLQSALEGLTSIGEGNMSVTGSAGVSYVCEFIGTLGETSLALMVIDDALVTGGGAVEVTIAETVDGGTGTPPAETDLSLTIETVVLNSVDTDLVPVGARFTIVGETSPTVHVVSERVPTDAGPTTEVTFTPALGAGSYGTGAAITVQSQEVEIKVGEGDLKYTEADEFTYDLERGVLDTVRKGDDQPMELALNFVFDQVKSGTGEIITPIEALKGTGNASEWVTSSSELCDPYAVDLLVEDVRTCVAGESRDYLFPVFRSEKRDYSIKDASIAVSGKCNATEPTITVA